MKKLFFLILFCIPSCLQRNFISEETNTKIFTKTSTTPLQHLELSLRYYASPQGNIPCLKFYLELFNDYPINRVELFKQINNKECDFYVLKIDDSVKKMGSNFFDFLKVNRPLVLTYRPATPLSESYILIKSVPPAQTTPPEPATSPTPQQYDQSRLNYTLSGHANSPSKVSLGYLSLSDQASFVNSSNPPTSPLPETLLEKYKPFIVNSRNIKTPLELIAQTLMAVTHQRMYIASNSSESVVNFVDSRPFIERIQTDFLSPGTQITQEAKELLKQVKTNQ